MTLILWYCKSKGEFFYEGDMAFEKFKAARAAAKAEATERKIKDGKQHISNIAKRGIDISKKEIKKLSKAYGFKTEEFSLLLDQAKGDLEQQRKQVEQQNKIDEYAQDPNIDLQALIEAQELELKGIQEDIQQQKDSYVQEVEEWERDNVSEEGVGQGEHPYIEPKFKDNYRNKDGIGQEIEILKQALGLRNEKYPKVAEQRKAETAKEEESKLGPEMQSIKARLDAILKNVQTKGIKIDETKQNPAVGSHTNALQSKEKEKGGGVQR